MPSVVTDPDFELDDDSRKILDEERKAAGRAPAAVDSGAAKPPPEPEAQPEPVAKAEEKPAEAKAAEEKPAEAAVAEKPAEAKAAEEEPEDEADAPRELDGKFSADPKKIREHERAKRKKAQAALAEANKKLTEEQASRQKDREEFIAMKARLEAMQQFMQQPPRSEAAPRSPEPTQPVKAPETPAEVLQIITPRLEAMEQRQVVNQQVNDLATVVRSHVSNFMQRQPDYGAAFQHLVSARRSELSDQGYNEQEIQLQLAQDETAVAVGALQRNKDPAAVIYNMAVNRGYRKAEQQPVQQAAPAPVAVATPAIAAAPSLATIAAGQQAARSLGTASGAAPPTALSPQEIVSLSDDDWGKLPLKERMKALRA